MRSEVRPLKTDQSDKPLAGSDEHYDLCAAAIPARRCLRISVVREALENQERRHNQVTASREIELSKVTWRNL